MSESSFPQFTQLPVELRRHIWTHALPAPSQIYELSMYDANFYAPTQTEGENGNWPIEEHWLGEVWNILFVPKRATPSILQTCQEARELGRRHYIAKEQGCELRGSSLFAKVEALQKAGYGHPFHGKIPIPATSACVSNICCANNDLVHFLPFDGRLRRDPHTSIRIISEYDHIERFVGIRYLAISLPDLDAWLDQVQRSRLSFSGVDVLFVLHGETESLDDYVLDWSGFKEAMDDGSNQMPRHSGPPPIEAKSTVLVASLEAAMVEITRNMTGDNVPQVT
jgi:hypothetical protein